MSHTDLLLKYHQYQGESNDCAPFSAAIVVNTLRDDRVLNGLDLAEEMNRPRLRWWGPLPYLVVRRIPNWATFPWGIADVLQDHGVKCRWQFGAGPNHLQRALAEDRIALPIIGEHWPLWAHVKPLVAYHPQRGWGFADPAHNGTDIAWQRDLEFMRQWQNYGHLLIETL
jgi:hypothetical protein